MRIAIIEDKTIEREELKTLVSTISADEGISCEILEYSSLTDFENENQSFELIILDLKLPDGNGLELARKIKESGSKTGIIIITAFQEYVYEGYEVSAFRFIPKPVEREKLKEGILSFVSQKLETQSVVVPIEGQTLVLAVDEIVCIESQGSNCVLYLLDGRALNSKKSISEMESEIENRQFARAHRRFFVNMKHICSIEGNKIYFVNNFRAEVSRRNRADFDRCLISCLKER